MGYYCLNGAAHCKLVPYQLIQNLLYCPGPIKPSRPRDFGGKKQTTISVDQKSMKYTGFLLNFD